MTKRSPSWEDKTVCGESCEYRSKQERKKSKEKVGGRAGRNTIAIARWEKSPSAPQANMGSQQLRKKSRSANEKNFRVQEGGVRWK